MSSKELMSPVALLSSHDVDLERGLPLIGMFHFHWNLEMAIVKVWWPILQPIVLHVHLEHRVNPACKHYDRL